MSASSDAPFHVTERVRWEDVDLVGIMRYSAFTRMLDVAEQELWRAAGMTVTQVMDEFGLWLPRRNLQIDFLAPARFATCWSCAPAWPRWARARSRCAWRPGAPTARYSMRRSAW